MNIKQTIKTIKKAELFIGISSGLSWLAWAVGVPVILISGITPPEFEFNSNCQRLFNSGVCNSCFCNPSFEFDKGDWMYCPLHKGTERQFECSKSITPEMVMESVKNVLG